MYKTVFVTGKLAAQSLKTTLQNLDLDFPYEIKVMPLKIAAFMNSQYLLKHLKVENAKKIILPGYCSGNLGELQEKFGCEAVRGPKDLKLLPEFLGKENDEAGCQTDIKIIAEIVDAPLLKFEEILKRAYYYKSQGADIIDIGCSPHYNFPHLKETIFQLKSEGFKVSLDSFNKHEILAAREAGVDLILSVNSTNLDVAPEVQCPVVVIPDFDSSNYMESLMKNIEKLDRWGVNYIIDPILDPINLGFVDSVTRYREVRNIFPNRQILMGIGNVTELTDADTTGINAVLVGIATELEIDYILTTEVANHAFKAVSETRAATNLMAISKYRKVPPKRLTNELLTIKDRFIERYSLQELKNLQKKVKDKNYRIFVSDGKVCVFNGEEFFADDKIENLLNSLSCKDKDHAYYLGREIYKAFLALRLNKHYIQDEELDWGCLGWDAVDN